MKVLEGKWGRKGLKLVSIMSALDEDRADGYLADKDWPGYLCVDEIADGGIGLTFTDYSIDRFNLPRTLLVDLDGKVVWEGDPGFRIGQAYQRGMATYLDSPLKELIEKRDLENLKAWHRAWAKASEAARSGDFTSSNSVLADAAAFDAKVDRNVARAQAMLAAVQRTAEDPIASAEAFMERGAEPAMDVLLAWGEALGVVHEPKVTKELKKLMRAGEFRDWDDAITECRRAVLHLGTEREALKLDELEAELSGLDGQMVAELLTDLRAARTSGGDLAALLDDAAARPARWLAQRYFAW